MNKKIIILGGVVLLIVGVVAGLALRSSEPVTKAIDTGTGTPTEFDGIAINGGIRVGVPSSEYPMAPAAQTVVGNGLATLPTSGSFADATTTIFAVANPFLATSTASCPILQGQNGTTTIDILVGTSTKQYLTKNSDVSATLINSTLIATSTKIFLSSGITVGPGTGFNSSGTGTFPKIVVGPSEFLVGLATSSYAGSSATGKQGITNTNNTFSGTYACLWER